MAILGRGSREFAGKQSEEAQLLSDRLEQGPYHCVSVLHLHEPFLKATPKGWCTGAATFHLCNNKLYRVSVRCLYYRTIVKTVSPLSAAAVHFVCELFTLYCPEPPSLPALFRNSLSPHLLVLLLPLDVILL